MLDFTKELQRRVRDSLSLSDLITTHVVQNLVFVPIMVGLMFFLIAFYHGDTFVAFSIMVWCFILHSVIFFWYRYELPTVVLGMVTIHRPRMIVVPTTTTTNIGIIMTMTMTHYNNNEHTNNEQPTNNNNDSTNNGNNNNNNIDNGVNDGVNDSANHQHRISMATTTPQQQQQQMPAGPLSTLPPLPQRLSQDDEVISMNGNGDDLTTPMWVPRESSSSSSVLSRLGGVGIEMEMKVKVREIMIIEDIISNSNSIFLFLVSRFYPLHHRGKLLTAQH